jgi:tRNA 2-thiouridine synthesizing protein A
MSHEFDARGLICPLPVLKARKALKSVPIGEVLTILTTDPGAPEDLAHFCQTTGNALIGTQQFADHARSQIRRVI